MTPMDPISSFYSRPVSRESLNDPMIKKFDRDKDFDNRYSGKEIIKQEINNPSINDHMLFLDKSPSSAARERLGKTRIELRPGDKLVLSAEAARQSAPQSLDELRAATNAAPKDLGALLKYKIALQRALEGVNWRLNIFSLLK